MSELPAAVAVVGVGLLGGRLARELVSSPTTPVLSLHSARPDRRRELESAFGKARRGAALQVRDRAEAPPEQTEVVVLTGAQDSQVAEARQHLERGRHVVTTVDAHSRAASLLALDPEARRCGRTVVVASCFSPGLSDVLAAWGEQRFDSVDEMHFARHGAGGPGCARDRLDALRREAHEWRDGAWVRNRPGSGRQLCWFPDPVAGRDAYLADTAEPVLATRRVAGLARSTARIVLNRRDRLSQYLPRLLPAPAEGGVGALRVEIRGRVGRGRETVVLGALDRPVTAAAAMTAEIVLALLAGEVEPGAHGAGSLMEPAELLRRIRRRGIRVAELDPGSSRAVPVG